MGAGAAMGQLFTQSMGAGMVPGAAAQPAAAQATAPCVSGQAISRWQPVLPGVRSHPGRGCPQRLPPPARP